MSEIEDIKKFNFLMRLLRALQAVKQLSWEIDQTGKRYSYPEALTSTEMDALTMAYKEKGELLEKYAKDFRKVLKDGQEPEVKT